MTRAESARTAALHRWSRENPIANAKRGQAGLWAKFRQQAIDHAAGKGERLDERELDRRTHCLLRLHMQTIRRANRGPAPA
ncbi:MAG TPA: hypothetical protein VFR67_21870 [Pilimelia sp.]|nr:hypothetical protein [Pilimelia sp.]